MCRCSRIRPDVHRGVLQLIAEPPQQRLACGDLILAFDALTLHAVDYAQDAAALRARGAVNVLLSPNEMGELFKVIALGRGVPGPLLGFARGDKVHTL